MSIRICLQKHGLIVSAQLKGKWNKNAFLLNQNDQQWNYLYILVGTGLLIPGDILLEKAQ